MKYKLLGIFACLLGLMAAFAISPKEAHTPRYHQHRDAPVKTICTEHGDHVFCTHLPLVQIHTNGRTIPGRVENGKKVTQPDGTDTILANITITDQTYRCNHITDPPQIRSAVKIGVRGNSSRTFQKVGYALELVDAQGEKAPQAVMGMAAHDQWALHGPYLDKTLLQNYMWYNLAGEMMDYAPNVRFCEVLLNGVYQGVYVMTETITAGDACRLPLSAHKKDHTFTGYALCLDRESEIPVKNIDPMSQYTYRASTKMKIVYPGKDVLDGSMNQKIAREFSQFEKALYSYDYDDKTYGYSRWIDIDSFVDYFLINELTCNYDAGWLSTYIYRDVEGMYRMCVWDFNSACNGYETSQTEPQHFALPIALWFNMLVKDEDFTERIISRYWELRESLFSDQALNTYIDETVTFLGPAIARNYETWGDSFQPAYDFLVPAQRNPRSYDEAIRNMKQFLKERTAWLDENIETIRQYSAESKVKKYTESIH